MEIKDFEKALRLFCEDFAHRFITFKSVDREFRKMTGKDMQVTKEHLTNMLSIDLRDWLDENGLIKEED